jgi:hypothetical protein
MFLCISLLAFSSFIASFHALARLTPIFLLSLHPFPPPLSYPTVRADGQYRKGTFYIEIIVDFLAEGGYLLVRERG